MSASHGAVIMIGVLVFTDFQLLDAAGPISVFEIAARLSGTPPSVKLVAATPGPVRSSSGVEMLARGLKPAGAITTLIVAGGAGVQKAQTCETTRAFLRTAARRGVRIASGQAAVRVQVNPTALSSYGIKLEDVRTALQSTSLNSALGNFDGPHQDYQIDANDQLLTSKEFANVVIAYHNGSPVKPSDAAKRGR